MFRMSQSLKLPCATRIPPVKNFVAQSFFQNLRQEFCLGEKKLRFQSGFLARFLNCREIDVRGQILFAGVCQQIVVDVMSKIGAQRAVCPRG